MAGTGGKRPGAGRKEGTRNRKTMEREELAALLIRAQAAETALAQAKGQNKKLGKDILDDFANLFAGMAAYYQPRPIGQPRNENEDMALFKHFADKAVEAAGRLAPFQSPTFRAINVTVNDPPPAGKPPLLDDKGKVIDMYDGKDQNRAVASYMRMIRGG